jgi:2,3-bisphosphoglycerate-independent phosphoglycerate mutase
MTEYENDLDMEVAYPTINIKNHLTEVLNGYNKKVLKVTETEKYAHVTYFFNGNKENPYPNENRELIASKIVTHYEDSPEMQADKITKKILLGIKDKYDLIVANYSNADMIGHTGNLKAAIKAIEFVDKSLGPLIKSAQKGDCVLIITADHGNAEQMIYPQTGEAKTKHTLNPVPFYLIGEEFEKENAEERYSFETPEGILSDIAPTILDLMQIPKPLEMTGESLLGILK